MISGMKKLFFLVFLLIYWFQLFSAEKEITVNDLDFTTGLRASYCDTKIVFSDDEIETSLIYMVLALEVDFDIVDFLSIGVIAGYNWSRFENPLSITSLPLSLEIEERANRSMVFGLNLKSEFFSSGDFSIFAKAEFIYFKLFKQEREVNLSVVSGSATIQHWFYRATLDLILKYHGFQAIVPFLGPQVNIIGGELKVTEDIEDITGEEELTHHQKNLFGMVGGILYDFGRDWQASLEVNLFSQLSITIGIFYQF